MANDTTTVALVIDDLPELLLELDSDEVIVDDAGAVSCVLDIPQMTVLCDAWAASRPTRRWKMTGVIYRNCLSAVLVEANPAGFATAEWSESFPGEWHAGLFETSTFPFRLAVSVRH